MKNKIKKTQNILGLHGGKKADIKHGVRYPFHWISDINIPQLSLKK